MTLQATQNFPEIRATVRVPRLPSVYTNLLKMWGLLGTSRSVSIALETKVSIALGVPEGSQVTDQQISVQPGGTNRVLGGFRLGSVRHLAR